MKLKQQVDKNTQDILVFKNEFSWIKKFLGIQTGLLVGIFLSLLKALGV